MVSRLEREWKRDAGACCCGGGGWPPVYGDLTLSAGVRQYQHAEHFRHPKDAAALEIFRLSLRCFEKFIQLTDRPRIEKVEVAYKYGRLPLISCTQRAMRADPPLCGPVWRLRYAEGASVPARSRRPRAQGFSVLLVDGPGMGESIRFRGIPLHADYELVGSACLDYLAQRADVDKDRVAVVALSLGGYFAPRCASLDHRFKACVAWGRNGCPCHVAKRLELIGQGKTVALPVPVDHVRWVFGVETFDQALEELKDFKLDGIVQAMKCPFLLTHGTEDKQVPMADAQKLFDAVGAKDKTFRIFTPGEGGASTANVIT